MLSTLANLARASNTRHVNDYWLKNVVLHRKGHMFCVITLLQQMKMMMKATYDNIRLRKVSAIITATKAKHNVH